MNKPIIAVDVDLTVVDTLNDWLQWFSMASGGATIHNKSNSYDLVPEMKKVLESVGRGHIDPFMYWRMKDLYDNLEPVEGSVEKLQECFEKGFEIVFVSLCVPSHTQSKIDFVNKYFPFHSGFIATDKKELVRYDYLIDDKHYHIVAGQKQNLDSKHFLFTQVSGDYIKYPNVDESLILKHWNDFNPVK